MTNAHQHDRRLLATYDEFDRMWMDGWRLTLEGVDAPRSEMQVLWDLARGRNIRTLRNGLEIVRARNNDPVSRLALAEQLRGFLFAGLTLDFTEYEATERETQANERGNLAQFRRAYCPSAGTRDGVIEAMLAQEVASRMLADVMHRERPTLVAVR